MTVWFYNDEGKLMYFYKNIIHVFYLAGALHLVDKYHLITRVERISYNHYYII